MPNLLRSYANFAGRTRRRQFWLWTLGFWIVLFALMYLDAMLHLGGSASGHANGGSFSFNLSGGILALAFAAVALIPNIAIAVRRLHDTNRSGTWLLAPVPFYVVAWLLRPASPIGGVSPAGMGGIIGFLVALAALGLGVTLLVFMLLKGTRGSNIYGADPKDSGGGPRLREMTYSERRRAAGGGTG